MWKYIKGAAKRFLNLIVETLTTGGAVLELATVYAAAFRACDNKKCQQEITQLSNYVALGVGTGVLAYQFTKYIFLRFNSGKQTFNVIDKGKECVVDIISAHSFNLQLAFFIHTAIARAVSDDPNQKVLMPDWQFWAFHFPPTSILAITANTPARRWLQYKIFGSCCAPCGRPEPMSTLIQNEINQNQRSTNQKIVDIGHEALKGLAAGHGWIHQWQDFMVVAFETKKDPWGGVWTRLGVGSTNALLQGYIAYNYTPLKSSEDIFHSSIPVNIQTILTAFFNTVLTWSTVLSEAQPYKKTHAIWYGILYGGVLLYALLPELPDVAQQQQIVAINNNDGGDAENDENNLETITNNSEEPTETTPLTATSQTTYEATDTSHPFDIAEEPIISDSIKITNAQRRLFTLFKENMNNANKANKEFNIPLTFNAFVK